MGPPCTNMSGCGSGKSCGDSDLCPLRPTISQLCAMEAASRPPFSGLTHYQEVYTAPPMSSQQQRQRAQWMPPTDVVSAETTYGTSYAAKHGGKMDSVRPVHNLQNSDSPMSNETTHRHDYQPRIPHYEPVHKYGTYLAPLSPMETTTVTSENYGVKPLSFVAPILPEKRPKSDSPFDGTTNYQVDYPAHAVYAVEQRPKAKYMPPTELFNEIPTYQRDYRGYQTQPMENMKPPAMMLEHLPFENKTSYETDYNKPPMPERERRQQARWVPNPAPLEDTTSYGHDYTTKSQGKQQSYAPDRTPKFSDAPMESSTVSHQDYQGRQAAAATPIKRLSQPLRQGQIDLLTTTQAEYTQKTISPTMPFVPERRRTDYDSFDAVSTYDANYKAWQIPELYKHPKAQHSAPTDPLQGQTSYMDDYQYVKTAAPTRHGAHSSNPCDEYAMLKRQGLLTPQVKEALRVRLLDRMKQDHAGNPSLQMAY